MTCIYLRHPIHGTKVATICLEAEADEKSGWIRYDPSPMNVPTKPLTEGTPVMYNKLVPVKKVK